MAGTGFVALQGMSFAKSKGSNLKVRVPTSLSISVGPEMFYSGGPIVGPDGKTAAPVAYGYARFPTYTVLDQNGNQLKQGGWQVLELVEWTAFSSPPNKNPFTKTAAVGSDGTFFDIQALYSLTPPPPGPGVFYKGRQSLTILKPGQAYLVRTNCLDQEYNDVTITDTSTNLGNPCN